MLLKQFLVELLVNCTLLNCSVHAQNIDNRKKTGTKEDSKCDECLQMIENAIFRIKIGKQIKLCSKNSNNNWFLQFKQQQFAIKYFTILFFGVFFIALKNFKNSLILYTTAFNMFFKKFNFAN